MKSAHLHDFPLDKNAPRRITEVVYQTTDTSRRRATQCIIAMWNTDRGCARYAVIALTTCGPQAAETRYMVMALIRLIARAALCPRFWVLLFWVQSYAGGYMLYFNTSKGKLPARVYSIDGLIDYREFPKGWPAAAGPGRPRYYIESFCVAGVRRWFEEEHVQIRGIDTTVGRVSHFSVQYATIFYLRSGEIPAAEATARRSRFLGMHIIGQTRLSTRNRRQVSRRLVLQHIHL